MEHHIEFDVFGALKGKERPRSDGRRFYTPRDTKQSEASVAWSYRSKHGSTCVPKGTPVDISIFFYIEMPKSWSDKKKREMCCEPVTSHAAPDIDNLVKTILDGLNGVAYDDDCCVWRVYTEKCWSFESRTSVHIRWEDKNVGSEMDKDCD